MKKLEVLKPTRFAAPRRVRTVTNKSTSKKGRLIIPPANFSLERNYHEVASFFAHFQSGLYNKNPKKRISGIDFVPLENVSLGASLVLAAELYRLNAQSDNPIKVYNFDKWNPVVAQHFLDLGLFDFLNVNEPLSDKASLIARITQNNEFIRFHSGHNVSGAECGELLDAMSAVAGPINAANFIYDGLVEAIKNSAHHAYPSDRGNFGVEAGTWLMSASYNRNQGIVNAAVYDLGVGIPETIPYSRVRLDVEEMHRERGARVHSGVIDGPLIGLAMTASNLGGESRTMLAGRGKGIPTMVRVIEEVGGCIRITSGKGVASFTAGEATVNVSTYKQGMIGTLIEWQMER